MDQADESRDQVTFELASKFDLAGEDSEAAGDCQFASGYRSSGAVTPAPTITT